MKKIILYGFSFICLGLLLGGCMPKDDLTYQGPNVVEFKNHLLGRVAARQPAGVTLNAVLGRTASVNTRVTDTIYVQLVGAQQDSPIDVNFNVAANSTAVAGTHYNFRPAGSTKVTIPAKSSVGYILVDMIPGSIPSGTFPLVINLTGNGTIGASQNYKTFTLTLRN